MGGSGGNDAKHRLSDGRDARDIVRELEQVASGEKEPARQPNALEWVVMKLIPTVVPEAGVAMWNTSAALLKDATNDDREAVLHAANERWGVSRRKPSTAMEPKEFWRNGFAADLRSRTGLAGFVDRTTEGMHEYFTASFGLHRDTRDAETIAEEFLRRVQGLATLSGTDATPEHFARAREDVLHGVPEHYRVRVLERILDREDAAAQEKDASGHESEDLHTTREERRARGWQALTGKGTPDERGGGRGR